MGKEDELTDHFCAGINLVRKVVVLQIYLAAYLFQRSPRSFSHLYYTVLERERSLLYFAQFRIVPLKLMTGAQIGSSAKLTPMLLLAEEGEEEVEEIVK